MRILFALLLLSAFPGYAGNSLQQLCSQAGENYTYLEKMRIQDINSSMLFKIKEGYNNGVANIAINNVYYAVVLDSKAGSTTYPASGQSIADMAKIAFSLGKEVNACVGLGYLWGIEY